MGARIYIFETLVGGDDTESNISAQDKEDTLVTGWQLLPLILCEKIGI